MTAKKLKEREAEIPQEAAQIYIVQMLEELSAMAQCSGLKDMASLLRATVAASRVDMYSET